MQIMEARHENYGGFDSASIYQEQSAVDFSLYSVPAPGVNPTHLRVTTQSLHWVPIPLLQKEDNRLYKSH